MISQIKNSSHMREQSWKLMAASLFHSEVLHLHISWFIIVSDLQIQYEVVNQVLLLENFLFLRVNLEFLSSFPLWDMIKPIARSLRLISCDGSPTGDFLSGFDFLKKILVVDCISLTSLALANHASHFLLRLRDEV